MPGPLAGVLLSKRHIDKTTGCWEWTGTRSHDGYGQIYERGSKSKYGKNKYFLTHRLSFETWNGPIPEGMFVCHHCDNPPCFNPDHLFVGTHKDNMRDSIRKGRKYASVRAKRESRHASIKLIFCALLLREKRVGYLAWREYFDEVNEERPVQNAELPPAWSFSGWMRNESEANFFSTHHPTAIGYPI